MTFPGLENHPGQALYMFAHTVMNRLDDCVHVEMRNETTAGRAGVSVYVEFRHPDPLRRFDRKLAYRYFSAAELSGARSAYDIVNKGGNDVGRELVDQVFIDMTKLGSLKKRLWERIKFFFNPNGITCGQLLASFKRMVYSSYVRSPFYQSKYSRPVSRS